MEIVTRHVLLAEMNTLVINMLRFILSTHRWFICLFYLSVLCFAFILRKHWCLLYQVLVFFMNFMLCFILQTLVINMLCFLCFLCFEHTDDQYTLFYDFVFSSFPVFQFQLRNSFLLLPRDFSHIFIKVFAQNIWKTSS